MVETNFNPKDPKPRPELPEELPAEVPPTVLMRLDEIEARYKTLSEATDEKFQEISTRLNVIEGTLGI